MDLKHQDTYISPFSTRYASREMSYFFSQHFKILTYRKLWIALAKAQHQLGLPISKEQISQMQTHADHIDFASANLYEKKFRHDVMAHIHAFGDQCPIAKPIIHLGATSCYVTDNADLIQCKSALHLLLQKLFLILKLLADLAEKHAHTPCLGSTHFQTAQPTTFGKRICLWLQDFVIDALDWVRIHDHLPFLGAKGATGTQSSFLSLFEHNHKKVLEMEQLIAKEFGFQQILPISGQTYPRKLDINILNAFASFAASAHKMGTDLRLLAHDGEFLESFEKTQVGSSAMPYKRNPIYSERICGLSRFLISLAQNPLYTTATQWLERSLDDSSNRRLAIPEAFLTLDALLNLLIHLVSHLKPMPEIAMDRLAKEVPYLSMENILMASVKKGGDRQVLHEKLRVFSTKEPIDAFLDAIEKDPEFRLSHKELVPLTAISSLIGRAPEQTLDFLKQEVRPLFQKHPFPAPPIFSVEI